MSAIVRADGDALVMHVGERPYVVVGTQTINISTHGLNLNQMVGMLGQLVPADSQGQLEEFGAVECKIPFSGSDDRFSVVAARGGDDVWIEIRRRRAPAPVIAVPEPPPVAAAAAAVAAPAPSTEQETPQLVETAPAVEAPVAAATEPINGVEVHAESHAAAPAPGPALDAPASVEPQVSLQSEARPETEPPSLQPEPESTTLSAPEAIVEQPAIAEQPSIIEQPAIAEADQPVMSSPVAEEPVSAAAEPYTLADAPQFVEAAEITAPAPIAEPVVEADAVEEPERVAEVAAVAAPEPAPEVTPAAAPEAVADVAAIAASEPVAEVVPVAEPEPAVEVAAVAEPEPVSEVAPAAEPEPVAEVVAIAQTEPVAEVAPVAEPEPVVEVTAVAEPEPAPEVTPAAEPGPVAEVAAIAASEPVAEVAPVAEPEPVLVDAAVAEPEPVAEAAPAAEPWPVAEVAAIAQPETVAATPSDAVASEPSVEPMPIAELQSAPAIEAVTQHELDADVEPIADAEPSIESEPVTAAAEISQPDQVASPEESDAPAPIAASSERDVAPPVVPEFIETAAPAAEAASAPSAPDVPGPIAPEEVVEPAAARTPDAPAPVAPDTIAASAHQAPDVEEDLSEPEVVMPLTRTVRIEVPPRVIPPPRPAPAPVSPRASLDVERLLRAAASRGASAVFLSSDSRPWIRLEGDVRQLETEPSLSRADIERVMLELAPESGHESIGRGETTEWILEVSDVGRVRCTTFVDHRGPGILLRLIATRAATAEQLGLSREIQALATESEGLVLVAGPRGSGKSTLMSALVDLVNRQRTDLVISLERQIRLVHDNRAALISQREIRGSAEDALAAARSALRENPDVLVVDDLLSPQMIPLLMDAAADGHLVLVSITAPSTTDAIGRLIELTPPPMRAAVRDQLAESFRGAVSQVLLKKTGGGLVAARELMLATAPVMRVIGEGQFGQLPLAFESGRKYGMTSLNDALVDLVRSGHVDVRDAFRKAADRDRLVERLKREGIDTSSVERLA